MKRTKKTEVVVERDQVLVIRRLEKRAAQWCAGCAAPARLVTVDEAAAITRLSARAVYRRVEDGQLHFTETAEGQLLICLTSLLGSI